jgi:hypothetical protein
MIITQFKCQCGNVFDVSKATVEENFESSYKCTSCGSIDTYRIWGVGDVSVAGGLCGNAKNGYERNITEMPGRYGKFKGNTIGRIK